MKLRGAVLLGLRGVSGLVTRGAVCKTRQDIWTA